MTKQVGKLKFKSLYKMVLLHAESMSLNAIYILKDIYA